MCVLFWLCFCCGVNRFFGSVFVFARAFLFDCFVCVLFVMLEMM